MVCHYRLWTNANLFYWQCCGKTLQKCSAEPFFRVRSHHHQTVLSFFQPTICFALYIDQKADTMTCAREFWVNSLFLCDAAQLILIPLLKNEQQQKHFAVKKRFTHLDEGITSLVTAALWALALHLGGTRAPWPCFICTRFVPTHNTMWKHRPAHGTKHSLEKSSTCPRVIF